MGGERAKDDRALVFVVDDDRTMRLLARESLELNGFRVIEARDGREALDYPHQGRPDIVLLDVDMPEVDGFAVCKELRTLPGWTDTPILMMTGLDDVESILTAYDVGATDFVNKPPNWVILSHRMRNMLRASQTAKDLRRSEARLASAQRFAGLAWWEWDIATNEIVCSDEFYRICGLNHGEFGATYESLLSCVHSDDRTLVEEAIQKALGAGEPWSVDHRVARADGTECAVHQYGQVTLDESNQPARVVGTIQDITARKQDEEKIRSLAYFDGLTGLPNRRLFVDRLDRTLEAARRHSRVAGLLFLDLDRFKEINDTLGHSAGDALLKAAGDRLQNCVRVTDSITRADARDSDLVARVGGDEFIILLTEIRDVQDAARVAGRVIEALTEPFSLNSQDVMVTASVGIAIYPMDGKESGQLLKNADQAMYHAKNQGRNNYQFYTESMNATAFERLALEGSLRRAVGRQEFVLHYQPQVDMPTGRIVGSEALVRWQHPELGLVAPDRFISLAEKTGLIVPLGAWVLREACSQATAWHERGFPGLRVAVNVSGRQFEEADFAETVGATLDQTGLDPDCLTLELGQKVLMGDVENSVKILQDLKALGARLSIDGFGADYLPLRFLRRTPLDALKISRSLISGVPLDPDDRAIVTAIVATAESLGLGVVAEGVETEGQARFLRERGCNEMQGYLVSPPVPADAIWSLLGIGGASPREEREAAL